MPRQVFVTGATGYLGRHLIPALIARGHTVHGLVRAGSESKMPRGCTQIVGNPFERATFSSALATTDTFVQLVGVPHPSPAKARQFVDIDLRSALESIAAAAGSPVHHFIYVSVAQPAPVMRAYQAARAEAEQALAASGLRHTILRPWYVLGPGHRWPYLLLPFYWLLGWFPRTREGAQRLGLVTLPQMVSALVWSVETAAADSRILNVTDIRTAGSIIPTA